MRNIDSKSRPRTQFRFKYLAVRIRLLRLGGSLTTFSTVSTQSGHQADRNLRAGCVLSLLAAQSKSARFMRLWRGLHEAARVHQSSCRFSGSLAARRARAAVGHAGGRIDELRFCPELQAAISGFSPRTE